MPEYDVIFVLPYLFSDHPSFPEGILKRVLESEGFSVGIIHRPFWQDPGSFSVLGKPRLFFAVISGPVDSVVLNYTSSRKRRMEDQYQTGGKGFFENYPPSIKYRIRPDNTVIVFANRIRENFKDVPIIIGGVEASLRKFAHYDFQKDKIRRSILFDSRADLLVSGPGEKQILNIARMLRSGRKIQDTDLPGTARITGNIPETGDFLLLPSLEDIISDGKKLGEAHTIESQGIRAGKILYQKNGDRHVLSYPPESYSGNDLDRYYSHNYTRMHPGQPEFSPALRMNLFSITSHRGCGGGCSFCSISRHEGKKIISRSPGSVLEEIRSLSHHREWKGIVSDIGGPSAEMYGYGCPVEQCGKSSCLFPSGCPSLKKGAGYRELLRAARETPGVKKVFIGSGVRFDNLIDDPGLLEDIMRFHSGRFLRIAPEHTEDHILGLMKKPGFDKLREFVSLFNDINRNLKRKIVLSPYLIIGHPGETKTDIRTMKDKLRSLGLGGEDAQIFTPTPGTRSTALYYSETTPDGKSLLVEKDIKELIRRKKYLSDQPFR